MSRLNLTTIYSTSVQPRGLHIILSKRTSIVFSSSFLFHCMDKIVCILETIVGTSAIKFCRWKNVLSCGNNDGSIVSHSVVVEKSSHYKAHPFMTIMVNLLHQSGHIKAKKKCVLGRIFFLIFSVCEIITHFRWWQWGYASTLYQLYGRIFGGRK